MNIKTFKNKSRIPLAKKLEEVLYYKTSSRIIFTNLGIMIKEIRVSFTQFFSWKHPFISCFLSLKYCFLSLNRLLLGRTVRLSYAYTGEDRLIESLLKRPISHNGYYVDVGCNDPRYLSNSFLFYRRGWRGICIDANEKLVEKFKLIRPRDQAICALVSDVKEEREFYRLTNDVLSTTERVNLSKYEREGQKLVSTNRKVTNTLNEILDSCKAPSSFDFLSIDVEEHDFQVLKSLNFEKYAPELIVIEDEDFSIGKPEDSLIYLYLNKKGYVLAGSILSNQYFIKKLKD